MSKKPFLIDFQKIGNPLQGFLSIASVEDQVPFRIERVFWNYFTPETIMRGGHAHFNTEMILIALSGSIRVKIISSENKSYDYSLQNPNTGIFLPKLSWHEMNYHKNAIQLVLCSTLYHESDYIRDKSEFFKVIGLHK